MRCHAAEPGAVTSLRGLHNPGCSWRAGRSVGFREEAARAPRGAALRTGRKGERNTSPGSGCVSTRPVSEERPGTGKTPRWSAGWRAPYVIGRARLARRACYQDALIGAPLPLFISRDGEKDPKVRPSIAATGWRSVGFFTSPRWGEVDAPSEARRGG